MKIQVSKKKLNKMVLSNCAVCARKKLTFVKNQELRKFND